MLISDKQIIKIIHPTVSLYFCILGLYGFKSYYFIYLKVLDLYVT